MRAKEQSASKPPIPDTQGVCAPEGSSEAAATNGNLEANLQDLHVRMRAMRYRHRPIRRVYIPKPNGKKRPLGISAFEDKLVQEALREVAHSHPKCNGKYKKQDIGVGLR